MIAPEPIDAGQKVEELQRVLQRSQAFLADLEARHHKHGKEEERASDHGDADDDRCDSQAEKVPSQSPPKIIAGLDNLKSRITQLFTKQGSKLKFPKAAETAVPVRRLSFSRVNIEFTTDNSTADTPAMADAVLLTSPQLLPPSRLQRSSTTSARTRPQASIPATVRAVSSVASSPSSSMCGNFVASASYGTSPTTSAAAVPPLSKSRPPDAPGPVPVGLRRASLGDVPRHRLQASIPYLASSLQQQRHIVFRDTVWSTSPDFLSPPGPLLIPHHTPLSSASPSAFSLRNPHHQIDPATATLLLPPAGTISECEPSPPWPPPPHPHPQAVRGCVRTVTSSRGLRDKALTDSQVAPALPQLHGTVGSKSQQQQQQHVPVPDDPDSRREPQAASYMRARSFTQGATGVGHRAAGGAAGGRGAAGGGDDATTGSRYFGASRSFRASSSSSSSWAAERGVGIGIPGHVSGGVSEFEEEAELSPPVTEQRGEQVKEQKPSQQQQQQQVLLQQHLQHSYSHTPLQYQDMGNLAGAPLGMTMRLAGIPETEPSGKDSSAALKPTTVRCGSVRSVMQFGGPSTAPVIVGQCPAGEVPNVDQIRWSRNTRRQTWSHEVFIPVPIPEDST